MNTYIELDTNSIMGEEIRKTIDVLSDMLRHHPLTEEESECLDMARFYLSRVNRAMVFQLKVRKEDDEKEEAKDSHAEYWNSIGEMKEGDEK